MNIKDFFTGGMRFLRPVDFIIILAYLGLFSVFLAFSLGNVGGAGSIVIQSNGEEYRYTFDSDQILEFDGPIGKTVVEIDSSGRARVIESDCRDQVCVTQGWLEQNGEWAACLPNRLIVRLDSVGHSDHGPENENPALNIDATAF